MISLRPYQIEAVQLLRDGFRKHKRIILCLPTGAGKCLAEDTPVLMYDGKIKKVQDIVVGDLLMGVDSTPRRVLSTCFGEEMMYDVVPSRGDKYTVNESHVLSLRLTGNKCAAIWNKKKYFPRDVLNVSVKEYFFFNKTLKHCAKGYRADCIEWKE